MNEARYPVHAFFLSWLVGIAVFVLLLAWAFFALRTPEGARDMAAPSDAAQQEADQKAALSLPAPAVPVFSKDDPYLLSAFSMTGMRLMDDAGPVLRIREPGSRFTAQVIGRDTSPRVLNDMALSWRLDEPYATANAPEARSGGLMPEENGAAYASDAIPLRPLAEGNAFAPYPTLLVEAAAPEKEAHNPGRAASQADAATRFVLPVSNEMGCRACHGGPWKHDKAFGMSAETAEDILAVHDKRNGTRLMASPRSDGPVVCSACHSGSGDEPNLSAAVHGFHAAMLPGGADSCALCHASGDKGQTQFYRDFHSLWGLDCTRCHGGLADHAVTLLKLEMARGVKAAHTRLNSISPLTATPMDDIKPRKPEENLPQCSGCHDFAVKPDAASASAFNAWTASAAERFTRATDNTGQLRCPTCHGAPHALYPAFNPTGDDRDNIQPLQYQGMAAPLGKDGNCAACHTVDMEYFVHHDRPE